MCNGCHGDNGEGTDDAPDLIGTRLTGDQISSFLQKPDAEASAKGMPNIPATSPDLQALVAYVLSIKRSQ
jgi:mono/diheme cytochrome c family protein